MYSIRDKKMSRNILLISISIFILAGFIYFSNSAYAGGKDMMLANAISGVSPLNKNITGVQSDDIMSGLKDKISGESAGLLDLRDRLKELKDPRINRIDGLRAGDKDVTETTIRLGGRIFIFPGLLPAGYLSSIMGSKDLFPVVIRIAFANGNRDQREITTNIWCFGEGWELL